MPTKMRYGVGELLARNLASLTPQVRADLVHERQQGTAVCPPKQSCQSYDPNGIPRGGVKCTKPGGICSVRRYQAEFQTRQITSRIGETVQAVGTFATICPLRFIEAGTVYAWIGSELLGTNQPRIVRELAFLESTTAGPEETQEAEEAVGRLDCVLVDPAAPVLTWCAVEMQAVYLSNSKTTTELKNLVECHDSIPFPVTNPRPDYRSSGPKRLLPQLQVKVPTLSRWGIKMAVVIDREFYQSMGKMEQANHPSNADIAWFVMEYQQTPKGLASLQPGTVHYTTLPEAIEGLVGADAIPKPAFEAQIAAKLQMNYPQPQ